jgi:hypothetical protein
MCWELSGVRGRRSSAPRSAGRLRAIPSVSFAQRAVICPLPPVRATGSPGPRAPQITRHCAKLPPSRCLAAPFTFSLCRCICAAAWLLRAASLRTPRAMPAACHAACDPLRRIQPRAAQAVPGCASLWGLRYARHDPSSTTPRIDAAPHQPTSCGPSVDAHAALTARTAQLRTSSPTPRLARSPHARKSVRMVKLLPAGSVILAGHLLPREKHTCCSAGKS